jgi:hypothetical protein
MRERFAAGRTELLRQLGRLAGSCNSSQVVETVPDLVSGRPAKSPGPIYDDAMTAEILVPARQGDSAALPAAATAGVGGSASRSRKDCTLLLVCAWPTWCRGRCRTLARLDAVSGRAELSPAGSGRAVVTAACRRATR